MDVIVSAPYILITKEVHFAAWEGEHLSDPNGSK